MKPKLYSSPGSQHSRRVLILIEELGLDVDIENVNVRPPGMGGDNYSAEFLARNPNGKVPVLEDAGLVLWESNAIMWYLADKQGGARLWPKDPQKRAHVAKWQVWQAAHLSNAADNLMYENLVRPMLKQEPDPKVIDSLTKSFHRWCSVLDGALSGAEYLANGEFTCADIAVATALIYARPARMPLDDHPKVVEWLGRVHARPSWKATEPTQPR
jgi:glutathione S-transferase